MLDIAAYVSDFLMTCPCLSENSVSLTVNKTGIDDPVCREDCSTRLLKPYLNGDEQKQFVFLITLHGAHQSHPGPMQLFEQIATWISGVSRRRKLPYMGKNRQPVKLEAIEGTYQCENETENNSTGQHSMQYRLTYYQKARK